MKRACITVLLSGALLACKGAPPAPDAAEVHPTPAAPRWEDLGVTGANHRDILKNVPDASTRAALARVLLADGNLACRAFTEREECGTTVREFEPVPEDATLNDVCLRRALLDEAVDTLIAANVGLTTRALQALLELPYPVNDQYGDQSPLEPDALPHRILKLADQLPAADRLALLRVAHARYPDAPALHLTGLPDPVLRQVYEELATPAALLALTPVVDDAYLLAAVAEGKLAPQLRREVLARAFSVHATGPLAEATLKTLQTLSSDDDCTIGYEADRVLAARGASAEPLADSPEHTLFVLCKLAQGADQTPLNAWVEPARYTETLREEEEHDAFIDDHGELTANNPPPKTTRRAGARALPPSVPFTRHDQYSCEGTRCEAHTGDGDRSCEHTFVLTPTPGGYKLRSSRGKCVSVYACPC